MSKNTSSEIKLTPTAPTALPALKGLNLQVFVMIAAIVVIMLFFTWVTDGAYLSARNISNLLRQTAITGILAVGMVFVIISAEIDLSVGSMMGLLGGAAAIFDVWLGWPLPLTVANTTVSQPMIALLLIACPLLPFLLMIFFKGDRLAARSRGAAWVCGYDHEQSMVVTAHGFAMPVKEAFAPLLKLRHWLNPVRLVPGWQSASAPALLRGMALVELAVLVVIVISRGA